MIGDFTINANRLHMEISHQRIASTQGNSKIRERRGEGEREREERERERGEREREREREREERERERGERERERERERLFKHTLLHNLSESAC